MIKKSLISAGVLLLLYIVFIAVYKPDWNSGQTQWQANKIRAQNFLYNKEIYNKVILGTSLSAGGIITDSLPKNIYNLGLDGQTIWDGFLVLERRTEAVKVVFIEMNVIISGENKTFVKSIASQTSYYFCKYLPWKREKYKSADLVLSLAKMYSMMKYERQNSITHNKAESEEKYVRTEMFNKLLKLQQERYSILPTNEVIEDKFRKLKMYTDNLEAKGIKIVFFEMPIEKELCTMPYFVTLRSAFYKNFPPSKYKYILQPDCSEYQTRDGIHINLEGKKKYTQYFKAQISTID